MAALCSARPRSQTRPSPLWKTPSTCCCLPSWTSGPMTLIFASSPYLRQTQSAPFHVYSGAEAKCQPASIPVFKYTQTTMASPTWRQTSCVWCRRTARLRTSHLWLRAGARKVTTTPGFPYETGKTKGKRWSTTSPFASPPCLTITTTCFSLRRPWKFTGERCANVNISSL